MGGTGVGLGAGVGAFAGVASAHEVARIGFRGCTEVTVYGALLLGSGEPSDARGGGSYEAVLYRDGELVRRPLDGTQRRQHYSLRTDSEYDSEEWRVIAVEGDTWHPAHQGMTFRICNEHCGSDCAAEGIADRSDDWCDALSEIPSGGGQGGVDEDTEIAVECTADRSDGEVELIEGPTTITESGEYRIAGDIESDGTCLTIESADVTIHGDGYALHGSGDGTGIDMADGTFIDVRDLTVHGFERGIRVGYGIGRLEGVSVEENAGAGLVVDRLGTVTCADCTIRGNDGAGVDPGERTETAFTGCEIVENGGNAVGSTVSTPVRVRDCLIADNGGPVSISPVVGPLETEIRDSVIRGNDGAGIRTGRTDRPQMEHAVPIRNCEIRDNDGPGIAHRHSHLEVRNCTIAGNLDGYRLDDPDGPYEAVLRHNDVEGNERFGAVTEGERYAEVVDAECNYWGGSGGPRGTAGDDGRRRVRGFIEYRPWSTGRFGDGEGNCVGGLENEEDLGGNA
ncbi:right-handed parallel beta-helix repeat-containing protein [Halorubrum aquaticum]|uniref:right-handed parallel beta-helix repeat-containing protein n=1 Tax=Halorubrum aquaticum TaxID=387340 RepID=UPI00165ED7FD|nr:right-handed parallel beta-helix repeat-containing protein [Halorubrum aquaticum]